MMLVSRSGSVLLLSGGLESGLATRVAGTLLAVDVERERERENNTIFHNPWNSSTCFTILHFMARF